MIKPLELHDQRHLEAAQGWFELGNCIEVTEELEQITPELRGHPSVLEMRYHIYAAAKKWGYAAEIARAISGMVPNSPFGWIHHAYALHELKRTQGAWNVLLSVVDKFPKEYVMRYNLACYACQLGNLKEARDWLKKAIDLAHTKAVKLMALNDSDLEPLWREIGGDMNCAANRAKIPKRPVHQPLIAADAFGVVTFISFPGPRTSNSVDSPSLNKVRSGHRSCTLLFRPVLI